MADGEPGVREESGEAEELRRSRQYLADAQRLSRTGSFAWSAVTRKIEWWSDGCFRVLGYDPADGLPSFNSYLERIHPEDRAAFGEQLQRAIERNADSEMDYRVVLSDGSVRHIHSVAHPILGPSGDLMEYIGTVMDVTEQKRAEEERAAHVRFLECMDRVNRAMQGTNDLEQTMSNVLDCVLDIFGCDRAWLIYPCDPAASSWRAVMEHTQTAFPGVFALEGDVPMDPGAAAVFAAARASNGAVFLGEPYELKLPSDVAARFSIRSQMAMALNPKGDDPYLFGLHQCSYARVWTAEDERLFQEIGRRLTDALTSLLMFRGLRESESKLEAAQRIARIGWWERDLRTKRVSLSDEVCRAFGVRPVDLPLWQERWTNLIHPEDREKTAAAAAAALRGGPRYDVDYRVVHPDGTVRLVHSEGDVTLDESGKPVRQFGILQDITERRRSEDELSEMKERFRVVTESSLTGIYLIQDNRFRYVNPAMAQMFGYTVDELVDRLGPTDLVYPEDRALVAENIRHRVDEDVQEMRYDFRGLRKDGSVFPVEVHGRRIEHAGKIGVLGTLIDNTERKRAEDELRASEARFRAYVDHATDAFLMVDNETRVVIDANVQACENLGYGRNELIGMGIGAIDAGLDEATIERLAERVRAGETVTFETLHRRKNGSVFPVEVRTRKFQRGDRLLRLALVRDITERKRAEQRMLAQHAVAQILAETPTVEESAPKILQAICERLEWDIGALWLVVRDKGVLAFVDLWRKAGVDAESFEAATRASTFAPGVGIVGSVWASGAATCIADVARHPNFVRAESAAAAGLHAAFAFPIVIGAEVLGVIDFFSREVREPDRELLDVMGTIGRQIGQFIERKRAEERYRATAEQLQRVMASISDYLWSSEIDEKGQWTYLYYSPVVERITGRTASFYMESPDRWLETVHPDDRAACVNAFKRLASGEVTHEEGEYRVILPDGRTRWVRDSATLTRLAPNRFRIDGVVSDIDERKRVEDALRIAQTELTHVARVMTMGELTASIAHEVNQPLVGMITSASSCSRWLAATPPNLERAQRALDRIVKAGARASGVIDRVRSLVKREPLRAQPLDVNELVREVIAITRYEVQRSRISLKTRLADELPYVPGDRVQLQQVVLNLMLNAIEATREIDDRPRQVSITTRLHGQEVVVEVRDSGIGFTLDSRGRLFEAFYTTKKGGLGMGLSISKSIVETHGGRMSATLNEPHGAVLQFSLPISADDGTLGATGEANASGSYSPPPRRSNP